MTTDCFRMKYVIGCERREDCMGDMQIAISRKMDVQAFPRVCS